MNADQEYLYTADRFAASKEQVESWIFFNNPEQHLQHHLLTLEDTIKDLDIGAIELSLEMLIRRHESLRTFFRVIEGDVKQCIIPYKKELFAPAYYDLRLSEDADKDKEETVSACKRQLGKVDTPPLVKCCIFRTSGSTFYLYLMVHHIIADAWSKSIIYRELTYFYDAFCNKRDIQLPSLKMQLKDYALWQKTMPGMNVRTSADYWGRRLKGLTETKRTDLLDTIRKGPTSSYAYHINSTHYSDLTKLAQYSRSGLLAVINAAFQLLFILTEDKDRVLIAMPFMNRHFPETELIIGRLGGGIYMCHTLRQEISVTDLIKEIYAEFLQSARHIIYNHEELALDGHSLRANCSIYVNFMSKGIVGDRELFIEENRGHRAMDELDYYALSCVIMEYTNGLVYDWRYNTALFSARKIELMTEKYRKIQELMCRHPEMTIKDLITAFKIPYHNGQSFS